ncbi:hypothetical protein [Alistipes sp. An66]|uniref:hypothetical protein n=1 Tax=Alistipes sp. An66 TaxID=1965650 RepID=UPI0011783C93|nr:hypothetical protein [Alistipes sp. An66]
MKKSKRKMRTKNASAGDGLLANPRIVARRRLKKPVLWAEVCPKGSDSGLRFERWTRIHDSETS